MAEEPGHIQITEFSKEAIPAVNWMMEDLFCRYGVSIPWFMLDYDFPDYSQRPDWCSGYNFNLSWGDWGYWLTWFNELWGLLFDEAHLPRLTLPDLSLDSVSWFNDYVNMLYDNLQTHYVYGQSGTFTKDEVIEGETSGVTGYYKWKDSDEHIYVANKRDTSGESVADFEDEKIVGQTSGTYGWTYEAHEYYLTYDYALLKYISRTGYSCEDAGGSLAEAWADYSSDPDWNILEMEYASIQLKSFYGYQPPCQVLYPDDGIGWRANGMKTYCSFDTSDAHAGPTSVVLRVTCNIFSNPTMRVYYHDFGDVLDSNDWTGGTLSASEAVSEGNAQTIDFTLDPSHVNVGGTSRYRISFAEIEEGSMPDLGEGWYAKVTDLELKLGYNE